MNQFIPVENESGKLSRGYAESKPFDKEYICKWVGENPDTVNQEKLLREKIQYIFSWWIGGNRDNYDKATNDIMELIRKGV